MNKPYTAKILGKRRQICGFNADGHLMGEDGQHFVVTPLDPKMEMFRSLTIREIATLTYSGSEWLLRGVPLEEVWFAETRRHPVTARRRTNVHTLFMLARLVGAPYPGPREEDPERLTELQNRVCAVAWMQQHYDDYPEQRASVSQQGATPATETVCLPAAKGFKPILLTAFHSISKPTPPPPEYFTSYAAAAAYVGRTDRTIKNWKSRGWLKLDQDGRKIRIARTELDRCKSGA